MYFNKQLLIRILERVGDSDEKNFTSVKEFIADTVKSVTEPEQPRLTIIFQWNPEVEFTSNDFTDNLLDACNYKILCAIQGKGEIEVRVNFGGMGVIKTFQKIAKNWMRLKI